MFKERTMLKSKIPVKTSGIPVRIDGNKNKSSATVLQKATVNQIKPGSASQNKTSKENLENVHSSFKVSTNKTLNTRQPNQVKNKISMKQNVKEIDRASYKKNNPSKAVAKSCKVKASTPVPSMTTRIKVQPTKSKKVVESHPSQPDIEFVPDEQSRKRILGCIELPPAAKALSRGQASIYDRPSLLQLNPIARPSDPCKALMVTLQRLKDRRDTFQSTNWRESLSLNRPSVNKIGLKPPDFPALKTLENIDCEDLSLKQAGVQATFGNKCFPLARKTPKMVLEEAKKRFEKQKQKEENKNVKKVTFQVANCSIGKENKCLIESKPSDEQEKKFLKTPDLKLEKTSYEKDGTSPSPLFPKNTSKGSQAASSSSCSITQKPVSILKNRNFTEIDVRRGSLFCSRPMRTGPPGRMRRSISFSSVPAASMRRSTIGGNASNVGGIQVQSFNPVVDLKLEVQPPSPAFFRRSISSPEFSDLRSSIAATRSEVQTRITNAFSPARGSILKLHSRQTNDIVDRIRSSVSASGLRGSLFLSSNLREVKESKNPKLCTPVPVSFYPRSQAQNFSPEFLCPRTSNYIVDAPIKTPLVLKHLAEREENDDLSQVRKKLNFMPPAEEVPKQNILAHAKKQNMFDIMADEECRSVLCNAIFPYICSQNILNPIARTLDSGDEMHFVPVSP